MKNVITAFFITFLALALTSSVLYFAWGIDLIQWYWKLLMVIIMFGVPTYIYFKDKGTWQ